MKKDSKKYKKGFTLVETLVAILILSLSLTATFTAAQRSLQQSTFAKDQITAFYLIQDAMEYIKNVRDTNRLYSINALSNGVTPRNWLYGLSKDSNDPCWYVNQGGNTCIIDTYAGNIVGYPGVTGSWGGSGFIKQEIGGNNPSYFFGYSNAASWVPTNFKREIQFQTVSASPEEVRVTVHVEWRSGPFSKSITVSENLLNR